MKIEAADRLRAAYYMDLTKPPMEVVKELMTKLHETGPVKDIPFHGSSFPGCLLNINAADLTERLLQLLHKGHEEHIGEYSIVSGEGQSLDSPHSRIFELMTCVLKPVDMDTLLILMPRRDFLKIRRSL